MRSFGSLAFRQVRSRRLRSLLTAAGIVLGVGMILGVLLLAATIHRTFNDLYDTVYGRTDLIVSGAAGVRKLRVVGLFEFTSGLDFGGQGFALMPLAPARRLMDKPGVYDEVDLAVDGGSDEIAQVKRRLGRRLPAGVSVETPQNKASDVEAELQAFNVILYFFAAMALFVGGFLIFNSFNMTVFQRTRELGMLRTLGAGRLMIAGSVLGEAALLGVVGAVLGLALGLGLAPGLIELMRALNFPVGRLSFAGFAPPVAVGTGLLTAILGALYPARRAGRTSPIRAILGTEG